MEESASFILAHAVMRPPGHSLLAGAAKQAALLAPHRGQARVNSKPPASKSPTFARMSDLIAVFTTVATQEQADALAEAAVGRGLAACVHAESVNSTYRWNGIVVKEPETRLLFKTTKARYAELEHLILEIHPYELPAVFAVRVSEASSAYVHWVQESLSTAATSDGAT